MKVRIDKCSSFGMRKINQQYSQYLPSVYIDGETIPATNFNQDFVYLGKRFNFDLNTDSAKKELKEKLLNLLTITSKLTINPGQKVKILKDIIYSKISFELKIYDFNHSWLVSEPDSLIKEYLRLWFQLPISSCVG